MVGRCHWPNIVVRQSRCLTSNVFQHSMVSVYCNTLAQCLFVCLPRRWRLSQNAWKLVSGNMSIQTGHSQLTYKKKKWSFMSMGETIKAYRFPSVDETSWFRPYWVQKLEIVPCLIQTASGIAMHVVARWPKVLTFFGRCPNICYLLAVFKFFCLFCFFVLFFVLFFESLD